MAAAELLREIGGPAGCRALSEAFYSRVKSDPVLRPFFPGVSLRCATEELSAFLVQALEGPPEATQKRWWVSLRESHQRHRIGPRERDAWLGIMASTLEAAALPAPAHDTLLQFFQQLAAHIVNTEDVDPGVAPGALASRQYEVDAVVEAVRGGHFDKAVQLTEASAYIQANHAVLASVLGLMLTDGHLTEYVRARLNREAGLAAVRYSGRTLLHTAAAAGDKDTVELLLRFGAPVDVNDDGEHTPLYAVANQCQSAGGPAVVHALVRAGAAVDACEGSKRCTPLHMAARRGNEAIAAALLESGAAIDARDIAGDTPLRRAVNCGKSGVAALLVAHGADRNSPGSKGMTPKSAARTPAMRQALGS